MGSPPRPRAPAPQAPPAPPPRRRGRVPRPATQMANAVKPWALVVSPLATWTVHTEPPASGKPSACSPSSGASRRTPPAIALVPGSHVALTVPTPGESIDAAGGATAVAVL